MHEYHGSFDGGASPQVNPQDGSAASAGPRPGTDPIPDADAGVQAGGSSPPRRSGSRIQGGLPSWDIRAKIAVVLSFVVLVTVFVLNRPRSKAKDKSTLVAAISRVADPDKPASTEPPAKLVDGVAAKEESESPPPAPTATATEALPKVETPPVTPAPIAEASPALPAETLPKDPTDAVAKPPAGVAIGKDETPALDLPTPKTGEKGGVAASLADAPIPPLDDKKLKEDPLPLGEKVPRLDGDKPSTPVTAEVPAKVVAEEPAAPVASMPPLSKTPSTAEPDRPATAEAPASAPSSGDGNTPTEKGFSIPSAGLVRTTDSADKKPLPGGAAAPARPASPPAAVPGRTGNDDGTLHVVRRGENFWTIARYHYASGRFYKALWYANRDLAKTPEDLYVGTAIRIPPVEDLNREMIETPKTARAEARPTASVPARKTSSRDGHAERTAVEGEPQASLPVDRKDGAKPMPRRSEAQPKAAPEASYRTYIVRGRNETLRSVARTQLGDGDRELEIEALNRDEFSDDSTRLRVGMTLRLPNESRTR